MRKRDPYYMYLGNLLVFEDGICKISDVKYVVIREKKYLFSKSRYYAFPGGQEVFLGCDCREVDIDDNDMSIIVDSNCNLPILVNAERLHDGRNEIKVGPSYVTKTIIENNDIKKLKALKF